VKVTVKAYRARAHYRAEEGYFTLDGVKKWQRRVGAFTQFHRRPLLPVVDPYLQMV
jgi:hypothetical protein